MKKSLSKLVFSLSVASLSVISGCSTSSKPEFDHVISYEEHKSLAYNVMKQIDAHYKVKEAELPEDAKIRKRSVGDHLFNTFVFSPNFLASGIFSFTSDDDHGLNQYHIITAVNLAGVAPEDVRANIAKQFINVAKEYDPNTEVFALNDGINGFTWHEKGERCTKELEEELADAIAENSLYIDGARERLDKGVCRFRMFFELVGPANPKIFPKAIHHDWVTVKMRPSGGHPLQYYFKKLDDAYLYYPPKSNRPPIVQHQDKVYFFVKKDNPNSPEVSANAKEFLNCQAC